MTTHSPETQKLLFERRTELEKLASAVYSLDGDIERVALQIKSDRNRLGGMEKSRDQLVRLRDATETFIQQILGDTK